MHIPVMIIKKIDWHPANEAPEAFKQVIWWLDERPLIQREAGYWHPDAKSFFAADGLKFWAPTHWAYLEGP